MFTASQRVSSAEEPETAGATGENRGDDPATSPALPDPAVGPYAGGVRTATWRFGHADAVLALPGYERRIPGQLLLGEAGDGRLMVTARSLVSGGELQIPQLLVDPPPPRIERRIAWTPSILVGLGVAAAAVLLSR